MHIAIVDVPAIGEVLVASASEFGHAAIKARAARSGKPSYGGGWTKSEPPLIAGGPRWIRQTGTRTLKAKSYEFRNLTSGMMMSGSSDIELLFTCAA